MKTSMIKRYEDRDLLSASDLEQAYYNLRMLDDEQPDLFVAKMEQARKRLKNEASITMTDEKFLLDILGRLPKGADSVLGPYQVAKMHIEPKVKSRNQFDVDDLVLELMKVYQNTFDRESQPEKDVAGEKAYAGIGRRQFKGRCGKCGKQGHKARDCRSSGTNSHAKSNSQSHTQSNKTKTEAFQGECFYCHKKGHRKNECRSRMKDLANRDNTTHGENANQAIGEIVMTAIEFDDESSDGSLPSLSEQRDFSSDDDHDSEYDHDDNSSVDDNFFRFLWKRQYSRR